MIKPELYTGRTIKGTCLVTRKLDGVRMLRDAEGNPVSRNGKPLHNLHRIPPSITDAEIFTGSWASTVSAVRTHEGPLVPALKAYSLSPIDKRLIIGMYIDIEAEVIQKLMCAALERGDEGLVLYTDVQGVTKAYKVKPKENYDVPVTGSTLSKSKGKYAGMIGALITPKGKVSGMGDKDRKAFTKCLPEMIEVECMGLTENGKFRHPRFVRERFDK
jgi:hypothetical protein